MRKNEIQSERGSGLMEKLFVVALIAAAVWVFNQWRTHQDGFSARPSTHNSFEDKPK